MKRILIIFLAFFISCGILFLVVSVLEPKPIAKMNPTQFSKPEEIGAVVYRRLRQDIRKAPLIILGSSPWVRNYEDIWSGFLLTAYHDQKYPKRLYQDETLRSPVPIKGMEVVPLDWNKGIEFNTQPMELHLVHTVYSESAPHFDNSYISQQKKKQVTGLLSFTVLPFAVNEKELEKIYPSCPLDEIAETPVEQLGCRIKRVSKKFFRKKLSEDKLHAILEQHGMSEYILFVHEVASSNK